MVLGKEQAIPAHNSVTTQTTQHHSFGEVYECLYKGELTALKLFRNTSDEDAIKEIEVMFALRHPNIIGLYAWVVQSGQINQYGYVCKRYKLSIAHIASKRKQLSSHST